MENCPLVILAPIAGLAFNVISQILLLHLRGGRDVGLSIIAGALGGITLTLLLTLRSEADGWLLLVNLLTALALSFCYWAFLNLNITSLRIRLLKELLRGGLPRAQLLASYNEKEVLERRLARLVQANEIRQENGRYYISDGKLLIIARAVNLARRLILPS